MVPKIKDNRETTEFITIVYNESGTFPPSRSISKYIIDKDKPSPYL